MYPKILLYLKGLWSKTGLKRMIFGTRLQGGSSMSKPLVSELTYPLIRSYKRKCDPLLSEVMQYFCPLKYLKLNFSLITISTINVQMLQIMNYNHPSFNRQLNRDQRLKGQKSDQIGDDG
ncbi:Hypothetical_protein [Hexamita inflata]|uniref:Hypothetical_protein n=1 Tax=Hexamita inflata TaxID=28002 RepID=A0AA86UV73_9EUKA|nr:Hypothetical protein HINF_LOCUS53747 [Hexamita inflata]